MPQQTRIIARAIIQQGDNMLLCRAVNDDHYFFPGGGVEFGEGAEEALRREVKEELDGTVLSTKFIGVAENQFTVEGKVSHELNLIFSTQIYDAPIVSKEAHIEFDWIPKSSLEESNILPVQLTTAVVKWLKDGQVFWCGLNPQN